MTSIVFIGGAGAPLSIVRISRQWTGSLGPPGPTSITLNNAGIGTPDPTRHIFVVGCGSIGTTNGSGLASATIGGVSATLYPKTLAPNGQAVGFMGACHYPTGSTANIVMQFENDAFKSFTVFVYAAYNMKTLTPIATNSATQNSSATTLNAPINVQKGGILLGYGRCFVSSSNISSPSVANIEDEWNGSSHHFSFWEDVGQTGTPRPVTFQRTGAGSAEFSAAVFSFR